MSSSARVDRFLDVVKERFGIESKIACSLKLAEFKLKSKDSLGDKSVKDGSLLVLISSGKVHSNVVAPENKIKFTVQHASLFLIVLLMLTRFRETSRRHLLFRNHCLLSMY